MTRQPVIVNVSMAKLNKAILFGSPTDNLRETIRSKRDAWPSKYTVNKFDSLLCYVFILYIYLFAFY